MPSNEQGVTLDRYMLIPRSLIFLTHEDKVLLLKGAPNKRLWAGLYNGVGGHVEQGEDILSAAKRELAEETGLTPTNLWLCGTVTVDVQSNPGVCIFIYKGECDEIAPTVSREGTLEWIEFSKVDNLPLVADLPMLLAKTLKMRYGDSPFSAHSSYNQTGELVIRFAE